MGMVSYPVNLDIKGKKCIIIGAGEVAARKIQGLLQCNADIHVISPEMDRTLQTYVARREITYCKRPYKDGDLEGAFLVFAVTDHRPTQKAVENEAKRKGILVNIGDDPQACSFQVPAKNKTW